MHSRHLLPTLMVATLLCMAAAPAMAHAKLVKADPGPDGNAMPMPAALRLTFSEAPELAFTRVEVTGPDQKELATGKLMAAPDDPDTVIVPLPKDLPDGSYTVDWTAVADDGHKTSGHYGFKAMK